MAMRSNRRCAACKTTRCQSSAGTRWCALCSAWTPANRLPNSPSRGSSLPRARSGANSAWLPRVSRALPFKDERVPPPEQLVGAISAPTTPTGLSDSILDERAMRAHGAWTALSPPGASAHRCKRSASDRARRRDGASFRG